MQELILRFYMEYKITVTFSFVNNINFLIITSVKYPNFLQNEFIPKGEM